MLDFGGGSLALADVIGVSLLDSAFAEVVAFNAFGIDTDAFHARTRYFVKAPPFSRRSGALASFRNPSRICSVVRSRDDDSYAKFVIICFVA
jgi:hypothetical protein